MTDINKLKRTFSRVALAGRELGSGPAEVLRQEEFAEIEPTFEYLGVMPDFTTPMALGVVLGLVMAEDPGALKALERIHEDWLQNRMNR
jgi:hypothetical protein